MMLECLIKANYVKYRYIYISVNRNLIYYSLPDLLRQVKIADRAIILWHRVGSRRNIKPLGTFDVY